MRRSTTAAVVLVILLATSNGGLSAGTFTFTLTDNWSTPTYGATELPGGAGTDFTPSSWESAANAALLEVKHSSMTGWDIAVRKVDTAGWAATNLKLDVRRTPGGAGGATLSGGTNYLELTSTNQAFFRGVGGDKKNIPLQYRIRNISVTLGAATFGTTVYYTITEY